MAKTTISIEVATRERIKGYKTTKLDTYDEILNRVFDELEKRRKEA